MMLSGQNAQPTGRAGGSGYKRVRKQDAFPRDTVEVGGFHYRITQDAGVRM